jgi:hypothetical protein
MSTLTPIAPPPAPLPFPPPFLPDDALLKPYPWWRVPKELGDLFSGIDTRSADAALTDRDRDLLRATARDIRRLRRELASAAPSDRRAVLQRTIVVLAYALGLCDAKRLADGVAGLSQVANLETEKLGLDAALQEVEANLLALADPTRGIPLVGLGAGLILCGTVFKVVAALAE